MAREKRYHREFLGERDRQLQNWQARQQEEGSLDESCVPPLGHAILAWIRTVSRGKKVAGD
jgi:hypothetical protein